MTTTPPLTVYYNTRCPVCDAGIDFQRNRLVKAARAGMITFRDINREPDALQPYAATLNDVRRRLHATDADGKLYVGIDCAAAIWRRTPGDGWFAWLVERPIVHPLAAFCYDRFADVLYAWNRRKGHW